MYIYTHTYMYICCVLSTGRKVLDDNQIPEIDPTNLLLLGSSFVITSLDIARSYGPTHWRTRRAASIRLASI